ncbi:MAG: HEAT repeat domain-containing protein, partial [Bacteroidales bacterium]
SIRQTLESAVTGGRREEEKQEDERFNSISSSGLFIDIKYFELITGSQMESLAANSTFMEQLVNKAEKNLNPDILPLLYRIRSAGINNNRLNARLSSVIGDIESVIQKQGLVKSKNLALTIEESSNRKLHLQTMMSGNSVPVITDLMRLIRDQDDRIKRETIYLVGKFRIKELLPEICECLDNDAIANDAYYVLKKFGEEAYPALAGHYFRSSGNIAVRRLLIRLFSESGGGQAVDFLLPSVWSINRLIRKEAVTGLVSCGYRADEDTRNRLLQEVQDIIGLLTWNLSAQISLKENNNQMLYDTLEKETKWWSGFLFDLLSLIYDKNSLDKIKENLDSGTVESVNFALEMLDIVVDDEIKPSLTAFLDVVSDEDKVKNLFQFYPGSIPEYETLIQELVNKDYNHIGVWTKACSIRSLYRLPGPDETDFLVALLFGVHRILREEAFCYLKDNYDDVYSNCSYRLPGKYREQLELLLKEEKDEKELLYTKLASLAGVLPELPENSLTGLAEKIISVESASDLLPFMGSDFIIWPLDNDEKEGERKLSFNWHTAGIYFDADKIKKTSVNYYLLEIKEMEKYAFYESDNYHLLVRHMDNNINKDEQ